MTYTKPTVIILGDARSVIQAYPSSNYKEAGVQEGNWPPPHNLSTPAYDLDE